MCPAVFDIAQEILVGLRGLSLLPTDGLQVNRQLVMAIDWVERAHAAAGDGGISKGFDLLRNRWASSYPETTGYTIPTLLNAAVVLDRSELRALLSP